MTHSELLGRHQPGNGEGITGQDLLELLRSIPAQARRNYLQVTMGDEIADVTGISISQSDQAERWEFKLRLTTDHEVLR